MEDPEFRINSFFTELIKNINYWFEEGSFAADDTIELLDIKKNTSGNVDKVLEFDFQDEEYYYQVFITISLKNINEDEMEECYIVVKKYDLKTETLIRRMGKDAEIKDIDEDLIFQLLVDIDEESETALGDSEPDTLSDEDTDLEDTSLS
jgi:hypothetical protein